MDIKGDYIAFSTGRALYANGGIIGIGPFGNDDISEGYDGELAHVVQSDLEPAGGNYLTVEECRELADYMIARWERFRESCVSKRYRINAACD